MSTNLFFSPPVRTYNLLSSHHSACLVVEQLIQTSYVEFELEPYDDSSNTYYIIYSRLKTLKHKISKMIESIEGKYSESIRDLTQEQKTQVIGKMKDYMDELKIDHLKYLDQKQHTIDMKFKSFMELSKVYDNLLAKVNKNQEELDTIKAKRDILTNNKDYSSEEFVVLTGSCANKERAIVERLLFRKTHGHCYSVFLPRESDPHRMVFLFFVSRGVYKHIGDKLQKIFTLNNVDLFELPNQQKNLLKYEENLRKDNSELLKVLQISGQQLTNSLRSEFIGSRENLKHQLVQVSYLERLLYIICHSKTVGESNKNSNFILFTIHIPMGCQLPNNLPVSLISTSSQQRSKKPRTILPRLPCLEQVNMLTELYSIPKHNEILPSVFMLSTVPILFGMMFSDFGHGLLLLVLCVVFKPRALFWMMAFMSIYCGVIYNEFFGMKILRTEDMGILHGSWGAAENGLNFQNSLKMKISMIIAFVHMLFGMVLKMVNELKRSQTKMIFYDSLPKIGLLFTTVGYLVLLIITKWLTDFSGHEATAPSIINSMLQLYLGWNPNRKHSIFGSIERQKQIGSWSLGLSVFFIMVMVYNHTIRSSCEKLLKKLFLGKGRYNKLESRASYNDLQQDDQDVIDDVRQISQELQQEGHKIEQQNDLLALSNYEKEYYMENEDENSHGSELGPLEVFEFVLSLISSTTSYLRLFALSLAHAKLSHLLLTFLLGGLSEDEPNISMVKCLVFFQTTVGMMLVLDVMECIMHVVRLHWVEWMGKFYSGGGKLFLPQKQEDY